LTIIPKEGEGGRNPGAVQVVTKVPGPAGVLCKNSASPEGRRTERMETASVGNKI